jgi:hypothetical protein
MLEATHIERLKEFGLLTASRRAQQIRDQEGGVHHHGTNAMYAVPARRHRGRWAYQLQRAALLWHVLQRTPAVRRGYAGAIRDDRWGEMPSVFDPCGCSFGVRGPLGLEPSLDGRGVGGVMRLWPARLGG